MKKLNIIIFMTLIIILLAGCMPAQPNNNNNNAVHITNRGVGFVPSSNFIQSLKDADSSGEYIGFYTPFDLKKEIPEIVAVAYEYKFDSEPIVNINFFNAGTGQELPGYSKEFFKSQVLSIVSKYKPAYIGIGNEINRYNGNINEFVATYNDIYSSIKQISPNTKVFTVFQYESLGDASIINKLNLDVVGITSYPFIKGYKNSKDIPDNYYSRLSSIGKPIIFTEIGHNSLISEEDQANFVDVFYDRLAKANINPKIIVWGLLYDVPSAGEIWTAGLFKKDGSKKLAFAKWTGKNGS